MGGDGHSVDLFRRTEVIDENPRTDSSKFRVRDGPPDVHFRSSRQFHEPRFDNHCSSIALGE
jgi:hypothetical protein